MPSLFAGLLAVADDAIDVVNAEDFSFQPMREVKNGEFVPDPGRSAIAKLPATFSDPAVTVDPGEGRLMRASSGPTISVLEKYLPQGVLIGDRLTRADGGTVYEVQKPEPDGMGRVDLVVMEV